MSIFRVWLFGMLRSITVVLGTSELGSCCGLIGAGIIAVPSN
jgi:hypothetical protein